MSRRLIPAKKDLITRAPQYDYTYGYTLVSGYLYKNSLVIERDFDKEIFGELCFLTIKPFYCREEIIDSEDEPLIDYFREGIYTDEFDKEYFIEFCEYFYQQYHLNNKDAKMPEIRNFDDE